MKSKVLIILKYFLKVFFFLLGLNFFLQTLFPNISWAKFNDSQSLIITVLGSAVILSIFKIRDLRKSE